MRTPAIILLLILSDFGLGPESDILAVSGSIEPDPLNQPVGSIERLFEVVVYAHNPENPTSGGQKIAS